MAAKRKSIEPVATATHTPERILAAAEALFAEHGFDAVSINAIAEHAEVSKANVFHHFTSKNELYIAVLRHACRQSADLLSVLGHEDAPIATRLAEFARAHLQYMFERKSVSRLIARELLQANPRRARELAQQVFGDNFARLVEAIRVAQRHGELRAELDPAAIAVLILGANVFFFNNEHVLRHFPDVGFAEDAALYSAHMVEIVLHGVLAPNKKSPAGRTSGKIIRN